MVLTFSVAYIPKKAGVVHCWCMRGQLLYEHGLVDVDWTQQVGHPRHTLVEEILHQLIGGLSHFFAGDFFSFFHPQLWLNHKKCGFDDLTVRKLCCSGMMWIVHGIQLEINIAGRYRKKKNLANCVSLIWLDLDKLQRPHCDVTGMIVRRGNSPKNTWYISGCWVIIIIIIIIIIIRLVVWIIFSLFPYIGNNHPNWLIFFRGVETTNQSLNTQNIYLP